MDLRLPMVTNYLFCLELCNYPRSVCVQQSVHIICAAIGAILSRGALQMHFVRLLVSLLFSGGGLSLKKCILNQIALDQ